MLMIMKWTSGTFSFFSTFERIAKKILLAQIKANYSSGDDISEEETQEEESESDGDQEAKQGKQDKATDENGKSRLWASLLCIFHKAQVCIIFWIWLYLSKVN